MVSPISNSESTNFYNEYLSGFLFPLANREKIPFGLIRNLVYFSTPQTDKKSWTKLANQIGENIG